MIAFDLFTHVDLQDKNTLAVPAVAGNYVKVTSVEELQQALKLAQELDLKILILGGGSNVVLPDLFVGLVIHIAIQGFQVVAENDDYAWLKVGAGENWQGLVEHCLDAGYWGLENLSLIPGTVGAAPIQNIGAYGVELKDLFAELTALERRSQVEVTFDCEGCEFGYRDSIFKNRLKDQYVITSVTLRLRKQAQLTLSYPALQQALGGIDEGELHPRLISETVCRIRREKLPDPQTIPNAGSFFKNPIVSKSQAADLRQQFPNLVSYALDDDHEKLAAGWLIDQAGWRGREQHGVGMHEQQALVLINPGRRRGEVVLEFAEVVQADIRARFGVDLEIEPAIYRP